MPRPFLTAEWRNLFLATYAVPPALLEKRLAPGLSLDMRDGNAFVSLVAFEFLRDSITVTGGKPSFRPGEDSAEHFFKEHHWGFGVTRSGQGIRYEVAHPVWDVYPVRSYDLDFDFAAVYGAEWGILQQATPLSTVLAVGSPISVYPKGQLMKA